MLRDMNLGAVNEEGMECTGNTEKHIEKQGREGNEKREWEAVPTQPIDN